MATKEYCKEFARLNAGRKVVIARRLDRRMTMSGIGHEGMIRDGYAQESMYRDGWHVSNGTFVGDPADFDPIDGLGPLKFPAPIKIEMTIEVAPRDIIKAPFGGALEQRKPDLNAAANRALSFLSGLFLTDHPISTQRELLAVVRALQSAVKK